MKTELNMLNLVKYLTEISQVGPINLKRLRHTLLMQKYKILRPKTS